MNKIGAFIYVLVIFLIRSAIIMALFNVIAEYFEGKQITYAIATAITALVGIVTASVKIAEEEV